MHWSPFKFSEYKAIKLKFYVSFSLTCDFHRGTKKPRNTLFNETIISHISYIFKAQMKHGMEG